MTNTVLKGWNAKIYWDGVLLGYAESAKIDVATGLESFYEVGSKHAVDLVEGNEEVTGSFSKAWINGYYLGFVSQPGLTSLSEFNLYFSIGSGPSCYVYCYNCKLEKGAIDIPQDGFLKEDYDFRAKWISIV